MRRPRLFLSILILFTFGVYSPCLFNGYVYDDADIVRAPSVIGFKNEMVAEVQPIGKYYSSHLGEGVAGMGRGYRPTTVLSWALVHAATRSSEDSILPDGPRAPAWPQHFVNVALHCLAVWLTFQMLVLLVGVSTEALLGTAVFGLHALRSDPVISLVGRAEILGYVFGVLGLLAYVAALRRRGGVRFAFLSGTGVALFLSFTAKENSAPWVVFLPLFVLAMGWLKRGEMPSLKEQALPWLVGVVPPFLIFLGLYFAATSGLGEFAPNYQANPLWYLEDQRIGTGVMVMGYGLYKLLMPFSLACDYGAEVFIMVESLMDPRFLGALVVMVGFLGFGVARGKGHPLVFLAVAMFFGFTFVGSNILFPIETIFGERLYYTPGLACSFLVVWLAGRLRGTSMQTAGAVVLGLWCVVCSGVILKRDFDWRDNASLFAADVISQPRSLSMLIAQRPELEFRQPVRWKKCLDEAYALNPTDPSVLREMALFLNSKEQFAEAQKFATEGLASKHPDAAEMKHELHVHLGRSFEGQKQLAAAEQAFQTAANTAPEGNPTIAMQYGEFYLRHQRPDEARAVFRTLMKQYPKFIDPREMLLRIAQIEGKDAEVQALVQQGLAHSPNSVILIVHMAILKERQGNLKRAFELYTKSVPQLPKIAKFAEYWHRFANLLAASGNRGNMDAARGIVGEYLTTSLPPNLRSMFVEMAKKLGM